MSRLKKLLLCSLTTKILLGSFYYNNMKQFTEEFLNMLRNTYFCIIKFMLLKHTI